MENDKVLERPNTQAEINEFRRRTLIEGTIKSLAENGVNGTTIRSICAEAGSSRGLISHYFENKEELLEVAFRHLYNTVSEHVLEAQAKAGDDPREKLMALPKAVFSPSVFTAHYSNAFLTFWHEIRFNDLVRRANREAYRGYQKRTEKLFEMAAEKEGVEVNSRVAALGLMTMIDGLWLALSIYDGLTTREAAIDTCQNYIDLQLKRK